MTELVNNIPLLLYFSASTYHYICVWFWGGQCPTSLISPKVVLLSSICTFVFVHSRLGKSSEMWRQRRQRRQLLLIFSSQLRVFKSTFQLCSLFLHNLFVRPDCNIPLNLSKTNDYIYFKDSQMSRMTCLLFFNFCREPHQLRRIA